METDVRWNSLQVKDFQQQRPKNNTAFAAKRTHHTNAARHCRRLCTNTPPIVTRTPLFFKGFFRKFCRFFLFLKKTRVSAAKSAYFYIRTRRTRLHSYHRRPAHNTRTAGLGGRKSERQSKSCQYGQEYHHGRQPAYHNRERLGHA